jgi:hypothetical protein
MYHLNYEADVSRFPIPWPDPGDPIGPWLRQALLQEIIDARDAAQLTAVQIELRKEAIDLQRKHLDLQVRALDAIAEMVQGKGP